MKHESPEAAGAPLRRRARDFDSRMEGFERLAAWVLCVFFCGIVWLAIWQARKPALRFIESPAFTAAPAPGGAR